MVDAATVTETMKDVVKEAVKEHLTETWAFVKADLINTASTIVLVGGAICIILYVAGWEKGMRYTGIMFVSYLLFRALLG